MATLATSENVIPRCGNAAIAWIQCLMPWKLQFLPLLRASSALEGHGLVRFINSVENEW